MKSESAIMNIEPKLQLAETKRAGATVLATRIPQVFFIGPRYAELVMFAQYLFWISVRRISVIWQPLDKSLRSLAA
jgi:hypothetical protein